MFGLTSTPFNTRETSDIVQQLGKSNDKRGDNDQRRESSGLYTLLWVIEVRAHRDNPFPFPPVSVT